MGEGTPCWVGIPIPPPLDIREPWPNSLLDRRSFGQVGGGHQSFRQSPVVRLSQLSPINRGGGHNWNLSLFAFYMCLSI